jgi:GDPmannose 4,6-dehydratase
MKLLVLGALGQTGSYLSELAISQGHEVIAVGRQDYGAHPELGPSYRPVKINLIDFEEVGFLIQKEEFECVVNLASLSSVFRCSQDPELSRTLNYELVKFLTNCILEKQAKTGTQISLVQASSSEMYGGIRGARIITEDANLMPVSVYGSHKAAAHELIASARSTLDLIAGCAILFNHESPRRSSNFVSRKIIQGARGIYDNKMEKIVLGNLDVSRDWGYAPEFAFGLLQMATASINEDLIFATGESHSIREFCHRALEEFGINNPEAFIESDSALVRSVENDSLVGDASKAHSKLGWEPKTFFNQLIPLLVKAEKDGDLAHQS